MSAQDRPSAISLMVKSNSLRAAKSISGEAFRRAGRVDGDLGADQPDFQSAVGFLERLDGRDIGGKRRRRGVQHHEIVVPRARRHFGELGAVRRRVDKLAAFDQGGRLGEPGRIPERADFAARLIARAGAAVEAVERGGLKK